MISSVCFYSALLMMPQKGVQPKKAESKPAAGTVVTIPAGAPLLESVPGPPVTTNGFGGTPVQIITEVLTPSGEKLPSIKLRVVTPPGQTLKTARRIIINIPPGGSAPLLAPDLASKNETASAAIQGAAKSAHDYLASLALAVAGHIKSQNREAKFVLAGFSAGGFAAIHAAHTLGSDCIGLLQIGSYTSAGHAPFPKSCPVVMMLGKTDFNLSSAQKHLPIQTAYGSSIRLLTHEGGHTQGTSKDQARLVQAWLNISPDSGPLTGSRVPESPAPKPLDVPQEGFPYAGLRATLVLGAHGRPPAPFHDVKDGLIPFISFFESMGVMTEYIESPAPWSSIRAAMTGSSFFAYQGHGVMHGRGDRPEHLHHDVHGIFVGDHIRGDQIGSEVRFAPGAIAMMLGACWSQGDAGGDEGLVTPENGALRVSRYSDGFLRAGASIYYAGHLPEFVKSILKGNSPSTAVSAFTNGSVSQFEARHSFIPDAVLVLRTKPVSGKPYPSYGPSAAARQHDYVGLLKQSSAAAREAKHIWKVSLKSDHPAAEQKKIGLMHLAAQAELSRITGGLLSIRQADPGSSHDLSIRISSGPAFGSELTTDGQGRPELRVVLATTTPTPFTTQTRYFSQAVKNAINQFLLKHDYDIASVADSPWIYGLKPEHINEAQAQIIDPPPGISPVGTLEVRVGGSIQNAELEVTRSGQAIEKIPLSERRVSVSLQGCKEGDKVAVRVLRRGSPASETREFTVGRMVRPRAASISATPERIPSSGGPVMVRVVVESPAPVAAKCLVSLQGGGSMELPMKELRKGSQVVFSEEVYFEANPDPRERRHSIRIKLTSASGEQLLPSKQLIQARRL